VNTPLGSKGSRYIDVVGVKERTGETKMYQVGDKNKDGTPVSREQQAMWRVTDDSEVMFLSGCDFDGEVLVRGRFYCQTDMLEGSRIVPKSSEFVRWVDAVLRLVKRNLQRVADLDAYVGPEATAWRQNGGRFASLALPGHGIISAAQRNSPQSL